jgi:hypothetical protein
MERRRDIGFGAVDRAAAIGFMSAIIQSFLTRRPFFLNARFLPPCSKGCNKHPAEKTREQLALREKRNRSRLSESRAANQSSHSTTWL